MAFDSVIILDNSTIFNIILFFIDEATLKM